MVSERTKVRAGELGDLRRTAVEWPNNLDKNSIFWPNLLSLYVSNARNAMDRRLVALKRLLDVMDELRVKCPWDRKQTFESLRMNTIEETYELADAILDHDLDNVKKELGDLLLHVVFYSKMGSEQQAFDIGDVADAICDKLIFRHPHVFGETQAEDAEQVKQNWEDLKLKEKALEHRKKRVLAGVPRSLPALVKAYRIGEKAAAAGFDWEKREDVWEKVKEETAEVQREIDRSDSSRAEEEFGDLFFALVNAARLYGVDPEAALEKSNRKFIRRFTHIEDRAEQQGRLLRDMTLGQMDALWNEAKKMEKSGAKAYLVNTGWNGTGKRISIKDTRGIIDAILSGAINEAPTKKIPYFDFEVPTSLPGVDPAILDPRDTYADAAEWNKKAEDLASRFIKNFAKYEGNEHGKALVSAGPQL